MRIPLALVAMALVVAAPSHAQVDDFELTVGSTAQAIPYNGTGDLPVSLTVGCAVLLQAIEPGAQSAEATFTLADPPAWLTLASTFTMSYSPLDCAGVPPSGAVTGDGVLKLQVGPAAPGELPQTVNVTATLGDSTQTKSGTYNVTYHPAHTITPSITFPYTVTGSEARFQVVVTVEANARSMVMFNSIQTDRGTFSGLQSETYHPPETKTFDVVYRPPSGAWTEAHVKFHAFSHILLAETGKDGPAQLAQDYDWVFVNGNPEGTTSGDDTKDSPDSMAVVAALGLLGAALVARRGKSA